MKIAVFLSGHPRTYRQTVESWIELRELHTVDFYLFFWDQIDTTESTWWHGERKSVKLTENEKGLLLEKYDPYEINVVPYTKGFDQWYLIGRCWKSCYKKDYDYYIKSRPDLDIHNLRITQEMLHEDNVVYCTPRVNRDACDAMFMGNYSAMSKIMDEPPRIAPQSIPENEFAKHCRSRNIKIKKHNISCSIVRANGTLLFLG